MTTSTEHARALADVRHATTSGQARAIRLAARLSLSEVGAACGVDTSTVHRWEHAQRLPRGDAALRYLALLRQLDQAAA
ncbi:MAG: helix-turn-helix transcriptional regulator [Acidimicrobiales bacterium]|nr:helix-turn-helix transcriptional regulator [Acidimicrobiales bacterium]